jgi:hypothetical protein
MAADRAKPQDPRQEAEQARALAARYRCEFATCYAHIDHDLFLFHSGRPDVPL